MENEIKNEIEITGIVTETSNSVNTDKNNNPKSQRKSKFSGPGVKIFIIIAMCVGFLIPQFIIQGLVSDREWTERNAGSEIKDKWGKEQIIQGLDLIFTLRDTVVKPSDNHTECYYDYEYISPEIVNISGDVKTSQLKRGIYDFTVYETELKIEGEFKLPDNFKAKNGYEIDQSETEIKLRLNQTHGICEKVIIDIDGEKIPMEKVSGVASLTCKTDMSKLFEGETKKFSINLHFKGSESLYFRPMAKTTNIALTSNCVTPSFNGDYLPNERNVTKEGFTASWNVFDDYINQSEYSFGVELKVPVEQYQQTERAVKYAFLIILLTFAAVFFMEMRKAKPVHPIQYLLVGVALIIFYLLLLSFSEHISFLLSYIIASVMTIGLITVFMASVSKDMKTALGLGALLTTIYFFIYILLQLETYALLAGSIGIFIVLAIAMYATQKIDWYKKEE